MADLQRRPNYTPRRAREQRAYRLAVAGVGFGGLGVIGIVLAIVGVVGAGLPVSRSSSPGCARRASKPPSPSRGRRAVADLHEPATVARDALAAERA